MSAAKKETPSLTAIADREVHDYVMARAGRLSFKQGKLMRRIINFWLAMGAPSLTPLDVKYPPPPDRILKYAQKKWAHYETDVNYSDFIDAKNALADPIPVPDPQPQTVPKRRRAGRRKGKP